MKDFDIAVLWAVGKELAAELPALALWLAGLLIVAEIAALGWIGWRDRGIDRRWLRWSKLGGLLIGVIGLGLLLVLTHSSLDDLGGPIDWIVAFGILGISALAGGIATYTILAVVQRRQHS